MLIQNRSTRFLAFLLVILMLPGCQTNWSATRALRPEGPSEFEGVSKFERKEIEIGKKIHDEMLSAYYLYTEPRLNGYINEIGNRLAQVSERRHLPYRFTVIVDPKIYATSAPGGFIYVTTGFLDFLENESELAAVLAHEIGQVQYKDPRLNPLKTALSFLDFLVTTVGPVFGPIGLVSILGVKCLSSLTDVKSKDAKSIYADRKALQYMTRAKFDPQGLWDILERIGALDRADLFRVFDYQQSRPLTSKRWRRLARQYKKMDLSGMSFTTNRERFLSEMKGVHEMYRPSPGVNEPSTVFHDKMPGGTGSPA